MSGWLTHPLKIFLIAILAAGGIFCFSCLNMSSTALAKAMPDISFQENTEGCLSPKSRIKEAPCPIQNSLVAPMIVGQKKLVSAPTPTPPSVVTFPNFVSIISPFSITGPTRIDSGAFVHLLVKSIIKRE